MIDAPITGIEGMYISSNGKTAALKKEQVLKISIITVTYNSALYLADCIRSVQSQTYPHIEHIIVDGKSTDGTINIIKKYEDGISSWVSETDRGMYDAINKGMNMATGDVIGLLNSDDVLSNDEVIADIVQHFTAQQTDAIYGDLEYVAQHDVNKVFRIWKGLPYNRKRFLVGWMPAHPTFYFKRKLLEIYGGYETHYFTASDYEFMARYLYQHKVSASYLPKLIVRMRVGGASNKNLKQRLRANRRDYLAMKRNSIPMAFIVSILKPLLKLHQFRNIKKG